MAYPKYRCASNELLASKLKLGLSDYKKQYKTIISKMRSFLRSTSAERYIVGISGGIDSALTAAMACEAVGNRKLILITMPSERITPIYSIDLAKYLADNLDCEFYSIGIKNTVDTVKNCIARDAIVDVHEKSAAYENLQARARSIILMTLANELNGLVLNTCNLSEDLTGHCTLYGDSIGAVSPFASFFKAEVYKFAEIANSENPNIPIGIIEREPSAELSFGQKDSDSLPPYPVLDTALYLIKFNRCSVKSFTQYFMQHGMTHKVAMTLYEHVTKLMKVGWWKMKQCPPALHSPKRK